jgi:uncharacterized membrane protein
MNIREGLALAEARAWMRTGEIHRRKFIGFRLTVAAGPWVVLAGVVAAAGYGAYLAFQWVTAKLSAPEVTAPAVKAPTGVLADVPVVAWLLIAVVALALVITVRLMRRPYGPGAPVLKAALAVLIAGGAVGGFLLGFH